MGKYGITDSKKAELDELELKVRNAEFETTQYQSIVDSLKKKSTDFTGYLATAEKNKETALKNKDLVDSVVQKLNDRPRKCLNFQSPRSAFKKCSV